VHNGYTSVSEFVKEGPLDCERLSQPLDHGISAGRKPLQSQSHLNRWVAISQGRELAVPVRREYWPSPLHGPQRGVVEGVAARRDEFEQLFLWRSYHRDPPSLQHGQQMILKHSRCHVPNGTAALFRRLEGITASVMLIISSTEAIDVRDRTYRLDPMRLSLSGSSFDLPSAARLLSVEMWLNMVKDCRVAADNDLLLGWRSFLQACHSKNITIEIPVPSNTPARAHNR
jgi:hypothetical protein